MGITWDDVTKALRTLPQTVTDGNLWQNDRVVPNVLIAAARDWVESGGEFGRSVLRAAGDQRT